MLRTTQWICLARVLVVPLLEKLMADGTLHEIKIDTEAIHTDGAAHIHNCLHYRQSTVCVDKVNGAISQALSLTCEAVGDWFYGGLLA